MVEVYPESVAQVFSGVAKWLLGVILEHAPEEVLSVAYDASGYAEEVSRKWRN